MTTSIRRLAAVTFAGCVAAGALAFASAPAQASLMSACNHPAPITSELTGLELSCTLPLDCTIAPGPATTCVYQITAVGSASLAPTGLSTRIAGLPLAPPGCTTAAVVNATCTTAGTIVLLEGQQGLVQCSTGGAGASGVLINARLRCEAFDQF